MLGTYKKNKLMKFFYPLLFLSLLLISTQCTFAAEVPEFIKMKDWKMQRIGTEKIVLTCKAVFYNPNNAKVKLTDISLGVAIGETKVGKILQFEKKVKIKKQSAFEIPLRIEINPETNAWGYIQGFLSAVTLQNFVLHVSGFLKVSVLGMPLKIRVDEKEELNLKKIIID